MSQPVDVAIAALDRFIEAGERAKKKRSLDPIAADLKKAAGEQFDQQHSTFMGEMPPIGELPAASETVDWHLAFTKATAKTAVEFARAIQAGARASVQAGGTDLAAQIKPAVERDPELTIAVDFDLENPRAVDYLARRGATQVTAIDDTTRDRLQALIAGHVEQGSTWAVLAADIADTFEGFSSSRAETIARTETADGYVQGNLAMAGQLADAGLEMEKSWLLGPSTDDEICTTNADAGWIPVDDTFPSGDDGPPGHPNCVCDLLLQQAGS